MKQEDVYNKYWDESNAFKLINVCIDNLTIIDEDIFIKKGGNYDYYITEMLYCISPLCGCGTDIEEKIDKLLIYLNCSLTEDEYGNYRKTDSFTSSKDKELNRIIKKKVNFVYDNEILYSFMDEYKIQKEAKEGLFEHGSSIGGCWLTEQGKFLKEYLLIYKNYLLRYR